MSGDVRKHIATGLIFWAAFAVLHAVSPARAFDASERSFERGRVDAIVGGKTKPADLAAIYGEGNVKKVQIHAPGGGQENPGVLIQTMAGRRSRAGQR